MSTEIVFILDELTVASPGQQLLDRFLLGYHHAGEFVRPGGKVYLHLPHAETNAAVSKRVSEFGLTLFSSPDEAMHRAIPACIVMNDAHQRERLLSLRKTNQPC